MTPEIGAILALALTGGIAAAGAFIKWGQLEARVTAQEKLVEAAGGEWTELNRKIDGVVSTLANLVGRLDERDRHTGGRE